MAGVLGDEVPAVVATGGGLIAFAQDQVPNSSLTPRTVVEVYRSTDGWASMAGNQPVRPTVSAPTPAPSEWESNVVMLLQGRYATAGSAAR